MQVGDLVEAAGRVVAELKLSTPLAQFGGCFNEAFPIYAPPKAEIRLRRNEIH